MVVVGCLAGSPESPLSHTAAPSTPRGAKRPVEHPGYSSPFQSMNSSQLLSRLASMPTWAAFTAHHMRDGLPPISRKRDRVGLRRVLIKRVEVEVAVRILGCGVDLAPLLEVLVWRRELAQGGRHGCKLGRREVHVSALTQTVGEVAR
eukprot:scaffold281025_cov31-Tisochrysis_lutea.AAC.3